MTLPQLYCFGFGLWKHRFVRAYLANHAHSVRFCTFAWEAELRGIDHLSAILVWGIRESDEVRALARKKNVPIWRMEDGFLRSVGLGTDFVTPRSLVVDKRGIYFDPESGSDLEHILEHDAFSTEELARAAKLREQIVANALSKYNFRSHRQPLAKPANKRVILVPGQVEQDASIARGCVDVRTNEQLLAEVRRLHPEAHLIYKPHPDVVSGNRAAGLLSMARAQQLADDIITDRPLPECLAIADQVHTMTSLVGFEALLRGIAVHTYGRPFYSGWGLTHDRHRVATRTRKLTLDMLVAGTLLRYPLYLSPGSGQLIAAEQAIADLLAELQRAGGSVPRAGVAQTIKRRVRILQGFLRGP